MSGSPSTRDEQKDLERRNHELSVLNAIARELNRSVDLSEALEFTLSQVAELLDLRTGWIWLMNASSSTPYLAASQNLPPALANAGPNPRTHGVRRLMHRGRETAATSRKLVPLPRLSGQARAPCHASSATRSFS